MRKGALDKAAELVEVEVASRKEAKEIVPDATWLLLGRLFLFKSPKTLFSSFLCHGNYHDGIFRHHLIPLLLRNVRYFVCRKLRPFDN